MQRLYGAALAMVLAIGMAGSSRAQQTTRTAEFNVGTVRIQVDLPDGYCRADQALFDATQGHIDGAATVTHILIVKCGAQKLDEDFFAIKTPKVALDKSITRPQLLAQLKTVFGTPDFAANNASAGDRATAIAGSQGIDIKFKGGLHPLGADETCAYMGGLITAGSGDRSVEIAQGSCMTAVAGRMVSIYSTGRGNSAADLERHVRASKTMALGMRPAPDQ